MSKSKSEAAKSTKTPKIREGEFRMSIPLKELEVDTRPESPFFDHEPERRPDREMVEDVKRRGVMLDPVTAQRIVDGKVRTFFIDGRSRYYSRLEANDELIAAGEKPVLKMDVIVRNDWSDLEVAEAVEAANAHRKSSSERARISRACALEKAILLQQKNETGRSNRKAMLKHVASVCSITVPQAERWLSFKKFVPEIQVALLEKRVAWERVDELVGVDASEQLTHLERWLAPPTPSPPAASEAPPTDGGQPSDTRSGKAGSGDTGADAPKPRTQKQRDALREVLEAAGDDDEVAKLGRLFLDWQDGKLETEALFTVIGFEPPAPVEYAEVPTKTNYDRAVFDHFVFTTLEGREPVSTSQLQKLLSAGTLEQIGYSLKRLMKAGAVATEGQARATRYYAVEGAAVLKPQEPASPAPEAEKPLSSRTPEGRAAIDAKVLAAVEKLNKPKLEELAGALPGMADNSLRCSLARLAEAKKIKPRGKGTNRTYGVVGLSETDDEGDDDMEVDATATDRQAEARGELPTHSIDRDTRTFEMWPDAPRPEEQL